MYEFTIEKILSTDKATSKIFLGAFAKNEVPTAFKFPTCFIVNTHARNRPGQHWLAFIMTLKGLVIFLIHIVDRLIIIILNHIFKEQPKNVITMTTEFKVILIFVVYIVYFIFYLKRVIKRKYFSLNLRKI